MAYSQLVVYLYLCIVVLFISLTDVYFCIVLCGVQCHFFFFKQKTAYELRISDWSSDVCSSDFWFWSAPAPPDQQAAGLVMRAGAARARLLGNEIGRASCRERVCQYV